MAIPSIARVEGSDTHTEYQPAPNNIAVAAPDTIASTLANAPLMFIENVGQFGVGARYQMRGGNHTLWLAQDALWITVLEPPSQENGSEPDFFRNGDELFPDTPTTGVNIRLQFVGANPTPSLEPFNRLDTTVSYFNRHVPTKWQPDVPAWGGVRYVDLYPGIDLEFSGEGGQLQPRLVVRDRVSLNRVQLSIEGSEHINLVETDGTYHSIHLTTAVWDVGLPLFPLIRPDGRAFEWSFTPTLSEDGIRNPFGQYGEVEKAQQVERNGTGLLYSTFLGGDVTDFGSGIAVDGAGNAYVIGQSYSTDFPTTPGAFDTVHNGNSDLFITKLNPDGSNLIYSTFLGGGWADQANGIAVDAAGSAYVTGTTYGSNFPTTPGAFDTSFNGYYDAFVTKLNPQGTALLYSTFLGGAAPENGYGIALDLSGNAYVIGSTYSADFPTTPGAFDSTYNDIDFRDGFITKLNPKGTALLYSTFLGGITDDVGLGITVDTAGNAYTIGVTSSPDFPATLSAFDTRLDGNNDLFVTKFNPGGSALLYSTFLGGSEGDIGYGIALDATGNSYLTGYTNSTNFPTSSGAFDTTYNGGDGDAFVAKLNDNGGTLLYGTFLGGDESDMGYAIVLDGANNAYLTGQSWSPNFPTTLGAFDTIHDGDTDTFVTKLSPSDNTLLYSTFLGGERSEQGNGIAVDAKGNAYLVGNTNFPDFPTTLGAFDTTHNGSSDLFITKLNPTPGPLLYLPLVRAEQSLAN